MEAKARPQSRNLWSKRSIQATWGCSVNGCSSVQPHVEGWQQLRFSAKDNNCRCVHWYRLAEGDTAPAAFNHRQSLWRQVQVQGLKQWCVSIYRTAAWMLVLESRTLCWNFWSGWTRPFLLSPVCRDLRSWLFFNVVLTLHFMEHFRSYATTESLQRHGGVYLRPWHLPFSPSAGLKGLLEPEAWIQAPNECMDVSIFKLGCIKAFQLTC